MDNVQCAKCGKFVEYLVDLGFCESCFRENIDDES